jgi:ketosteroid isomerase-like protein
MKRLVLTALLMMTVVPFAFGQTGKSAGGQEEGRLVDEFAAAMEHNDAAAVDRLMLPEYKFVTPTGAVQTKEDRLAPMRSGDLKYESVKYDEVDVRRYGEIAVVIARATVKGHLKATDIGGQFRATLVLRQSKGQWLLVSSQASTIAR